MAERRRHVAVVVPSLVEAGAEKVAQTLARAFAADPSVAVTVVTMDPRLSPRALRAAGALPWAERVPAGCRHVHLPATGSGLLRLLPLIGRFARLARRERFDTVYSFLTWTNVLVAAARVAGLGRYVHVASEHAMAESLRSDGSALALLAKTLPVVYRLPDRVVVVSEAARESLTSAGVLRRADRVVVVPNPVDVDGIAKLATEPTDVVLPTPVLACVGRLHVQKDHHTLLRALASLPGVELALIGDGPLREELRTTADRLGVGDRVRFLGVLPNPYPVVRQADVVVLPSREEGFGLVAVEAAALGVPFVGSDAGGLAEVCGVLGHRTFPVGDDAALAAEVRAALADPASRAARAQEAARRYDPAAAAARYLALGGPTPTGVAPRRARRRG